MEKLATEYDIKFNTEINLTYIDSKINIYSFLDCSKAFYLSKCEILNQLKMSPRKILHYLQSINN